MNDRNTASIFFRTDSPTSRNSGHSQVQASIAPSDLLAYYLTQWISHRYTPLAYGVF
jgi:hypothetical protein